MKTNDVLLLCGAGLAAWYFLGKKSTTLAAATEGVTGAIKGVTGGTGLSDLISTIKGLIGGITGAINPAKEETTTKKTTDTPKETKNLGGVISTSKTGLSLQAGWDDIVKAAILNIPTDIGGKLGAGVAAVGIGVGGIIAYKFGAPVAKGLGEMIGRGFGKIFRGGGGGALSVAGSLATYGVTKETPSSIANILNSLFPGGSPLAGLFGISSSIGYRVTPETSFLKEAGFNALAIMYGQQELQRWTTPISDTSRPTTKNDVVSGTAPAQLTPGINNQQSADQPLGGGSTAVTVTVQDAAAFQEAASKGGYTVTPEGQWVKGSGW